MPCGAGVRIAPHVISSCLEVAIAVSRGSNSCSATFALSKSSLTVFALRPRPVEGNEIREDLDYGGVRIILIAHLERARIQIQVDIGFGDAVTPPPEDVEFPTILEFPAPHLRAYRRETVVAESFRRW